MKNVEDPMSIKPTRPDMNQSSAPSPKVTGTSGTSLSKDSGAPAVGSQDTVTLTNTAAEMLKLEERLASIPDIDDARVAAIKEQIENGNYQIDAEKIVDSLFQIEKELS
ncbi:MAG: flagellar biosynthesis anti-sigma factor FlgM [Halioglobus sp.]|nr:flagellar biosynthesis anti-sigma factor FlgM [Halioglobus sp.]